MTQQTVAVCGGGIVGMTCVLALARAGIKATLIAPRPAALPPASDPYHPRVYAISPASQRFLTTLGIWDSLPAGRMGRMGGMEIRGDAGGELTLDAWQAAAPALGWIVEASEIERVLMQALAWSGATWLDDRVASWQNGVLHTQHGRVVDAALSIGADGAASPLRAMAGLAHESTPYGDIGMVAHLDAERPHQDTAFQWFSSDGILALLPLPDSVRGPQVSMVWSASPGRASDVQSLLPGIQAERLPAMLAQITQGRLGALRLNSAIHGFPLFIEHAEVVAPGVVLIGDAAHRVHPLAGQGLNLGLGDVEVLADVLANREPYRSVGDMRVLKRYRRRRAEPVAAMAAVTDSLRTLFTMPGQPVRWLRNQGLGWVDAVPALKRILVGQASGT